MKKDSFEISMLLIPDKLKIFIKRRGSVVERIARGSFWSLLGSVVSKSITLLVSIIVARMLGKTQFGQYGIIQSTIVMFATFAGFGLGMTSTKYVAETKNCDHILAGNVISSSNMIAGMTGGIFALLFLIAAPYIASIFLNASYLTIDVRAGAIVLLFSTINGAQTGALAGFEAFKKITRVNVLSGLLSFPFQVVLTYFYGVIGAVVGLGLNYFIQCCLNYYALKSVAAQFHVTVKYITAVKGNFSYLWKFSLPTVLNQIMIIPVMWYCNTLLTRGKDGFNEMAVFNAATQWQTAILFVPMAVSQIALPLFSTTKEDKNKYSKMIRYNLLLNVGIGMFLATVISVLSRPILSAYGKGFVNGGMVLILLSYDAVFIATNNVIGQIFASLDKMWMELLINLLWAVLLITLTKYYLANNLGAVGLALALFITYLVYTLINSVVAVSINRNHFKDY